MTAVSWMDSLSSLIMKGDVRGVNTAMKDTVYSDVVGLSFLLLVLSSDLLVCSIWSLYRPLSGDYVEHPVGIFVKGIKHAGNQTTALLITKHWTWCVTTTPNTHVTRRWKYFNTSQQLLSYGVSNQSKGKKKKTPHNIGDSVDWKSKQVTTQQFTDPLSYGWLFTFNTCSILFCCMSLIYHLDSTCSFCYSLSFCLYTVYSNHRPIFELCTCKPYTTVPTLGPIRKHNIIFPSGNKLYSEPFGTVGGGWSSNCLANPNAWLIPIIVNIMIANNWMINSTWMKTKISRKKTLFPKLLPLLPSVLPLL